MEVMVIVIALVVICLGFAIWEGSQSSTPGTSLLPIGVICVIAGLAGAGWAAFYFDITVEGYDGDEVVNLDAVGMRTIYFVGAAATFVAGVVMASAAYVIDRLRPRPAVARGEEEQVEAD